MDLFRVRLNCIDHYQATPTRYDPRLRKDVNASQLSREPKVPVIRVFGSTETGQKVCAHIHGAFPYMFVEYDGSLEKHEVGAYISRFHLSIDDALAVSYRRHQNGPNAKFVARITLVKGIPFYGFHVGYRLFLKIYMLNPVVMTRLADLLQQGVIMKRKFQPYEAHLQYLLQFMTDYNLYGCDYLDSSRTKFRSPVPDHTQSSNSFHLWNSRSVSAEHITDDPSLPRASHCSIEVDICVQDILNRKKVNERPLHHDFVERTNPISGDLKLVYSMAGLWKDETKRRKRQMANSSEGSSPFPPEALVSMSPDARDSRPEGWLHEDEYRDHIRDLIADETEAGDGSDLAFDNFVPQLSLPYEVKTVLQSVEDLFPANLAQALGFPPDPEAEYTDPFGDVEVGERKDAQVEELHDEFFPSDSDEEALALLESVEDEAVARAKNTKSRPSIMASPDIERLPPEALRGTGESGLATGKLPYSSFPKELAEAADKDGLIDKVPKNLAFPGPILRLKRSRSDSASNDSPAKRRKRGQPSLENSSTEAARESPSSSFVQKRPTTSRLKEKGSANQAPKTAKNPPMISWCQKASQPKEKRGPILSSFQYRTDGSKRHFKTAEESFPSYLRQRPTASQSKERGGSSQALDFAIVKDQNDPSKEPRLSQSPKSILSSSQQSGSAKLKKRVSFHPSTIFPEDGDLDDSQLVPPPSSQQAEGARLGKWSSFRPRTISLDDDDFDDSQFVPPPSSQLMPPPSSQQSESARLGKRAALHPKGIFPDDNFDDSQPLLSSYSPSSSIMSIDEDPVSKLQRSIVSAPNHRVLIFTHLPPSTTELATSFKDHGIPDALYQDPYYSRQKDVPQRAREYAGRQFRLEGNGLPFLPEFDRTGTSPASYGLKTGVGKDKAQQAREYKRQRRECSLRSWDIACPAPTWDEVDRWWDEKQRPVADRTNTSLPFLSTPRQELSQIEGPTPKNKHGFKYSQKAGSTSVEHEAQYMSTMSLEIHVNTRGKFVPNPEEDEVQCVFWALKSDETILDSQDSGDALQSGIVVLSEDPDGVRQIRRSSSSNVVSESSELDLLVRLVEIVRTHDPDVLTGYEVHGSSWGYLIERARLRYDYDLCDEFSRMKTESHGRIGKENDRWGFNTTSTIRVTGRHMINIWRAMRGELDLLQYTVENVVWHLLHRRIPHYAWKTLTSWYTGGRHRELARVLQYYQSRARLDIEILEANELISRTSEQARLLGVDFFSVFSRGSQFKVESIMFRIAKPENFLLVSPSRKQVGGQNALECLPLVMEPQSAFYKGPLLVLDFQSLYPSVMIAHNYCYSTFLGRITNWRGMNKMGFTEYKRQRGLLALLKDHINVAPNGMMFVKPDIRKSLLAKMLTEILETRVMVKSGMKQDKDDKTLQQLLNNRQLALKLLANVTYGYTSASFSGRMPCSEIADSIVQTGREILERAIAHIHSVERWGAEVVYGDTDSLFIYLKGRTRDQAFDIGNEISQAITEMNPRPIKLKFEKVYHPCVLLAKKRYVGYKYESRDQETPEFDAKGIETVRRDGTPAEQMIEEKALRMLFEDPDLSKIKAYFQRQCRKIMRNRVSVQDFCFAKEVRLGTYSGRGPPPPGALISTRRMLEDARAEPQYGERVPYVVITGAPRARLIDRCVAPEELLANPQWQLDAEYYITKNLIPPLERIFNLMGASVRQWYDEMPKIKRIHHVAHLGKKKTTIEAYMRPRHCLVCRIRFKHHRDTSLCRACTKNTARSMETLQRRVNAAERGYEDLLAVCRTCSGLSPMEEVKCESKDCPVFWTRTKQRNTMDQERSLSEPVITWLGECADRKALEW